MNTLDKLYKLDHTFCLNSRNIQFDIMNDEESEDRDCKDLEEMVDCIESVEDTLKKHEALIKILKKHVIFYENGGIAFKNISNKKNIKEFNLLKEVFYE